LIAVAIAQIAWRNGPAPAQESVALVLEAMERDLQT
jgi:hypothetical protein